MFLPAPSTQKYSISTHAVLVNFWLAAKQLVTYHLWICLIFFFFSKLVDITTFSVDKFQKLYTDVPWYPRGIHPPPPRWNHSGTQSLFPLAQISRSVNTGFTDTDGGLHVLYEEPTVNPSASQFH